MGKTNTKLDQAIKFAIEHVIKQKNNHIDRNDIDEILFDLLLDKKYLIQNGHSDDYSLDFGQDNLNRILLIIAEKSLEKKLPNNVYLSLQFVEDFLPQ